MGMWFLVFCFFISWLVVVCFRCVVVCLYNVKFVGFVEILLLVWFLIG